MFWRMALGVGQPYVFIIWLKMLFRDINAFQPMVGGVVGGATLKALLMWEHVVHCVVYVARCVIVVLLAVEGGADAECLFTRVWYNGGAVRSVDWWEFEDSCWWWAGSAILNRSALD